MKVHSGSKNNQAVTRRILKQELKKFATHQDIADLDRRLSMKIDSKIDSKIDGLRGYIDERFKNYPTKEDMSKMMDEKLAPLYDNIDKFLQKESQNGQEINYLYTKSDRLEERIVVLEKHTGLNN